MSQVVKLRLRLSHPLHKPPESVKRCRTIQQHSLSGSTDGGTIHVIAELHTIVNRQQSQIDDLRSKVARQQKYTDMLLTAFGLQDMRSVGAAPLSPSSSLSSADPAAAEADYPLPQSSQSVTNQTSFATVV